MGTGANPPASSRASARRRCLLSFPAPLRAEVTGAAGPLQDQGSLALQHGLHHYNGHRPHSALKSRPPISSLKMDGNNLLMLHS